MLQQVFKLKLKQLFKTNKKEKFKHIPPFLNRMSTLLYEGYTFSDSMNMLLPYHVENISYWREKINKNLRNGESIVEIFKIISIPNHFLVALKIAEEKGDLANSLKIISKQMDFHEKTKKKLLNLLTYPVALLSFLVVIFIAFRTFFLPNIENIIISRTNEGQDNLAMTKWFLHIPDLLFLILLLLALFMSFFYHHFKKLTVESKMTLLNSVPIINYFFKLQITKQFSRFIGTLLLGGFSLQQTFEILKEQDLNPFIKLLALRIEKQIIFGESFSSSIRRVGFFLPKYEEFVEHGEISGYLGKELTIYSELLDEKLQDIIRIGLSFIQPIFFMIIALSVIAAYLSILLPMFNLIEVI
nr:competence type IV pilus assembly protein ComGB [Lysinibacillus timonensis]